VKGECLAPRTYKSAASADWAAGLEEANPATFHLSRERFPRGAEEKVDRRCPWVLVADAAFAEIAGSAFLGEQRDGVFHPFFRGIGSCY
jgi:hypothetical protein